jgi:two-component system C4-dicarboxylate transport response regulator DctD
MRASGLGTMGKTILVVDGEPVVRAVITKILKHEGYTVFSTDHPAEALKIVKASKPCLVITNVNLTGISGHDAMRMFKDGCPGVPVLMVSGLPECETITSWMAEDGFDAFPKPFSAAQLAAKVRQVLAGSPAT